MSQSRQLAAIMFTDIVGYTALMGEDEQKAFNLLSKNRQIQRPIIERYGGKWIKELGDGVLASFPTATDAVLCAALIQQTCNRTADLRLRIGIHLGEVVFQDHDVFGDGVNIASRLQPLAPIGGVLISESVNNNVVNKKEIETKFLGEETLKNVRNPLKVYEVIIKSDIDNHPGTLNILKEPKNIPSYRRKRILLIAVLLLILMPLVYYFLFYKDSSVSEEKNQMAKSIAILYFDNMSGDPGQDYFSDGITEEIITNLSRIKDLRVISRTSVLPYKGKGKNIKAIATELNCNIILEGSVRKEGNKVRINAKLIDAIMDKHLWTQVFDEELSNIFEIQSSVATNIARKLQVSISPEAQIQIGLQPTDNMEAYDLYLQAKAASFKDWGSGVGSSSFSRDKAIPYLQKAIQLDPKFSEALALLSENILISWFAAPNNKLLLDSAIVLAQKAINYHPMNINGYNALAFAMTYKNPGRVLSIYKTVYKLDTSAGLLALANYYYLRGDFIECMKFLSEQIHYQPNRTRGYYEKGKIFTFLGEADSALKYFEKAKQVDPNDRDIFGWELYFYQFKGEVEASKKAAAIFFAGNTLGYNKEIAIAYLYKKDWANAEEYYRKTNYRDMDFALVFWKTGRRDSARKYLQQALDFREKIPRPWSWDLSRLFVLKGDLDKAIYYLNKGFEDGEHRYDMIKNDPYWDEIRNTPQFKKVETEFYKRNTYMIRQINDNEKKGVAPRF